MFENKGTQALKTQRLTLRRIVPEDGARMVLWMGDPEVCKYERWLPHESAAYSAGYIKEVLRYDQPETYQWGIEYEGELVGSVSVVDVNDYDPRPRWATA